MSARTLADQVPGLPISGYDLDIWRLTNPLPIDSLRGSVILKGQYIDLKLTVWLLRRGLLRAINLCALGMRMEHYAARRYYQTLFVSPNFTDYPSCSENALLINVRGAEILGNVHSDYGPLPLAFYQQIIESTGLHPVFMGQLGADTYSQQIRQWFPQAEILPSQGPLGDFQMLRAARHIVAGCSTFSWLAAWLSEATEIHLPVIGIFNPEQRPDIDLLPVTDGRYRYYRFPVRHWVANTSQVDELFKPGYFSELSSTQLQKTLAVAKRSLAPALSRYRRQLVVRAIMQRLFGVGGGVIMRR